MNILKRLTLNKQERELSNLDIEFIRAMGYAVEERGEDFRYRDGFAGAGACFNFDDEGNPACIIGTAYFYAFDGLPSHANQYASAHHLLGRVKGLTPAIVNAAQTAQAVQDSNYTWGHCYEQFVESLAHNGIRVKKVI